MPFIPASLSIEGIKDDLLDETRDLYKHEVACWRIIGPVDLNGTHAWVASRNSATAVEEFAKQAAATPPVALLEPDIEAADFSEKAYAMDYVMWRALGLAIAHYNRRDKPKLVGI